MRQFSALLLAANLIGTDAALNLVKRTDGSPKVVEHAIQRRAVHNPLQEIKRDRLRRRSGTITASLENEETLYFANISIGTPAQDLRLQIDTGSSDLWVNVANSAECESRGSPCKFAGTYDANSSSTYEYVNSLFNITYVDSSGAAGDYATDTVVVGGATLTAQEFGIGYESSSENGVMGVGYADNEAIVSVPGAKPYSNVPQHMVQAGLINSIAYSLWLNDLDASTGSILFGGVNTDQYTGSLETLPIIKEEGVYAEFIIALTAIGIDGKSGSIASGINTPALLDSGTSLMYLPNDIAQDIFDATGAKYSDSEGAAFVDCSLANNDTTIDFTFSSPTISVAMSELVIEASEENGKPLCILGIGPADGSTPVLGDTFLRSAYVVYDISNNEISIAQTNFNATSNNVMEITNGTSGVPDATGVTAAVTSVAVSSGGARNGGLTTTLTSVAAAPTGKSSYGYGAVVAAAGAGVMFAL